MSDWAVVALIFGTLVLTLCAIKLGTGASWYEVLVDWSHPIRKQRK